MYLQGSKWSMTRRKKRSNPWRVLILIILVAGAIYLNQVVVPNTPPLFMPTPTPTRSPESYVTEAQSLETEGKYSQAIESYKQAISVDPKNPSNFIALARLLVYTGNYIEAETNARNALLLNPNNSTANAMLGWILGLEGSYLEAESAFSRAIEQDPNSAIIYAYQAEVYALQSESDQATLTTLQNAIDASRKAQQLDNSLMESHRARGIVLELTQNYSEAVTEFEAAIAINPNIADLHLALGRNYRALEIYDKAIEEFTRANALNPADPLPDTYIARTYLTVGEFAKAIQFAQSAVVDAPQDPYMYGNLGTMYYRNLQYAEAVDSLRMAIKGGTTGDGLEVAGLPLDAGRVGEYYQTYGLALARRGECGEALQISQAIQQGLPSDETAMYNANEIINICSEVAEMTPTIEPSEEVTPTP
jgi:tetratricopeptide (TPR) repeat protein